MTGLPSIYIPCGAIAETAAQMFTQESELISEHEMWAEVDDPTPAVSRHMRELMWQRAVCHIVGVRLARTQEAAEQLVDAVIAYTHSRDVV